ncbi:FAD binding domain-containing protein [Phormidium tenue FACHB-886]|nr:FAD binding domain-containing protein [Phormidium tenue FACHB-886]
MDLHHIETYLCPINFKEIQTWQQGWVWLAGGTWIFSEPQPQMQALIDLQSLSWSELNATSTGLTIGATCVMNRLLHALYPAEWIGVQALQSAVRELASFKVQNVATVAGNLCLALPASTFAPVMLALGAIYQIQPLSDSSYWIPAALFQTGARQTILNPGDVLRKIWIANDNLKWRVNYQRICVASAGVAIATVVGAYNPETSQLRFGIGASIPAPQLIEFDHLPTVETLTQTLDEQIPITNYFSDVSASAAYRHHVTKVLLRRSLQELIS